jgi:hypothetical protein
MLRKKKAGNRYKAANIADLFNYNYEQVLETAQAH